MKILLLFCLASVLSAPLLAAQSHLVVVSGLGGEARYSDEFHRWGVAMVDAARERFGLAAEQIVYLAEKPERDPSRIHGPSTREQVERVLAELARRAAPTDRILILLIGHGSSDGRGARLNLPGPDITADELAAWLARFATQPVVVVNAASASGDFQEPLAAKNRAVITATRSGLERNETVFGRFFVEAFAGDVADTDKDGRVTVLEAFEYARREVERFYKADNRLQTEHARLEGNAEVARGFYLAAAARGIPAGESAELRALLTERQRLEERVEALRSRRAQMEPEAYEAELERLLVELALKNREIREKRGGQP
jgi:pimeloyl-ACP methyl ester carboxylesterase